MATRSRIGIQGEDGKIRSIYCHWDGYIDGNGKMLDKYYTTPEQVNALMDCGDISSLGTYYDEAISKFKWAKQFAYNINTAEYKAFEFLTGDVTMAYKDRGEDNVGAVTSNTLDDFLNLSEEYVYLFKKDENGKYQWYVLGGDIEVMTLLKGRL